MVNSRLCVTVRLIWTPVNADNEHLFLAQLQILIQKVNLNNVDTSLSIVYCNKPFLLEGLKSFS